MATGYKAVFIDTSPSHLPPKLWHKKSAFPIKISAHMQIVYVLSVIWALHLERKNNLLLWPVSVSLSGPLRLWSVSVWASVYG